MGGLAGYQADRRDIKLNEAQSHKEKEEKIGLGSAWEWRAQNRGLWVTSWSQAMGSSKSRGPKAAQWLSGLSHMVLPHIQKAL